MSVKIKENELDETSSMWEWKIITKFYSEKLKGKAHLEDLVIDGRKILKWVLGK